MSTKSQDKKKNKDCAKGQTKKKQKFAEVLSEPLNNYAKALKKLALIKSSNSEGLECVNRSFDEILQDPGFKKSNESNNFMNKDNTVKFYKNIKTSINKIKD